MTSAKLTKIYYLRILCTFMCNSDKKFNFEKVISKWQLIKLKCVICDYVILTWLKIIQKLYDQNNDIFVDNGSNEKIKITIKKKWKKKKEKSIKTERKFVILMTKSTI